MTSAKIIFILSLIGTMALPLTFSGCKDKSSDTSSSSGSCSSATVGMNANTITTSSTNVIPVYIADGGTTGAVGYTNEPVVSVTICSPNHTSPSQCQTVSNILLDTGSYGLRVFGSAINSNVALQQLTVLVNGSTYNVGQCEVFGSGADWGAVQSADVVMGNQTATAIPIQVININYAGVPSGCSQLQPDTDPCSAGYNGILGVGPFTLDCGADCTSTDTNVNPGNYFACSGSDCANAYSGACANGVCAIPFPTTVQVVNPVGKFANNFNNGISLTLPPISSNGGSEVQGSMTLGIGTPAGNLPGVSVLVYAADASGMTDGNGMDFHTVYNGVTYGTAGPPATQSFLDSGSNGVFFPNTANVTLCSGGQFYCPTGGQPTALSAVIKSFANANATSINFSILNIDTLAASNNTAFNDIGGKFDTVFDWGLPFFFGKTIYVGLDGKTAVFNTVTTTGPYWGF